MKHWTTFIYVVVSAVWLNFIVIPCVHATAFDQQTGHDCPHCPTPETNPCHNIGDNDCNDCVDELNTLKVDKYNQKLDDNTKYTVIPSSFDNDYTDVTHNSYVSVTGIEIPYTSLPIYLKNCAFLN